MTVFFSLVTDRESQQLQVVCTTFVVAIVCMCNIQIIRIVNKHEIIIIIIIIIITSVK